MVRAGFLRMRYWPTTQLWAAISLVAVSGTAQTISERSTPIEAGDRYDLQVSSKTYAELFRRALLPGPNGTLVETDTVVPVHEYLSLRVRDLDTGWRRDSLDLELAAFGRVTFADPGIENRADGDLQVASVRYRDELFSARLGRQLVVGGAARYSRFDGLAIGLAFGAGFDAEVYGGFTVLPRYDARPGYHMLGAAADSLLRDPNALPEPERTGNLLGGGRLGFTSGRAAASLSFHEQHQDTGLARRNLGVEGRLQALREIAIGGNALLELDAQALQDARLWVDTTPADPLDLSIEYLHTEPALFLSRQSVLSVFGGDGYDETGASAVVRATRHLALEGDGSVQFYDESQRGARGEIGVRVLPGSGKRTIVRLAYARVLATNNGYHSLRTALSRRLTPELTGTVEAYAYLYDEPIRGRTSSEVYGGTLGYDLTEQVNLLWGASLAQSPYAELDAQTLVRLELDFDFGTRSAGE
jgi:hypothetical protein